MKNKILMLLFAVMISVIVAGVASAASTVLLNTPLNDTTYTDTTARLYNFNVTGNRASYTCIINQSAPGADYSVIKTITNVQNATSSTSSPAIQTSNGDYSWKVKCDSYFNSTNTSVDVGTSEFFNYTLTVPAPTVTLNAPDNNSYSASRTVTYNFTVVGADTAYSCALFNNEVTANTYAGRTTDSNVANNTPTIFTRAIGLDKSIFWNVNCTGKTNTILSSFSDDNFNVTVDTVDPVITINSYTPVDGGWSTSGYLTIGATVNDTNADDCLLYSNLNATSNNTRVWGNVASTAYTTETEFNWTGFDGVSNLYPDNNTNAYEWLYVCNDSAGNSVTLTANRTVNIDTVQPSPFNFNYTSFVTTPGSNFLVNNSYATDYTPQVGWNITDDLNFSYYRVGFYNDSSYRNLSVYTDVTSRTTKLATIGALTVGKVYKILITAFDKAGNARNSTLKGVYYNPVSTCHSLDAGWNICGNLGNTKNLSVLLSETGGSTIAYFNISNQFDTYSSGGSYGGVNVPYGEAIFIYRGSVGTWSDSVRNVSAGGSNDEISVLRNRTNTDWNIEVARDSVANVGDSLQKLDYVLNGDGSSIGAIINVSYMSYFNNSASTGAKYTPFVANLTLNNDTQVNYGDTVWMFLSNSMKNMTLNWSEV